MRYNYKDKPVSRCDNAALQATIYKSVHTIALTDGALRLSCQEATYRYSAAVGTNNTMHTALPHHVRTEYEAYRNYAAERRRSAARQ